MDTVLSNWWTSRPSAPVTRPLTLRVVEYLFPYSLTDSRFGSMA